MSISYEEYLTKKVEILESKVDTYEKMVKNLEEQIENYEKITKNLDKQIEIYKKIDKNNEDMLKRKDHIITCLFKSNDNYNDNARIGSYENR